MSDTAAVLYLRVSSAAQVDGTSLATQERDCRACAARMGTLVLGVYAREFPGGLLKLDPAFAYAEPPSS